MNIAGTIAISGHQITLEAPQNRPDAIGARVNMWLPIVENLAAWVQDARAEVVEAYARREMKVTHCIYTQLNPGIQEGWRLRFGTRVFRILGVVNMAGLGELYRIDAVGI